MSVRLQRFILTIILLMVVSAQLAAQSGFFNRNFKNTRDSLVALLDKHPAEDTIRAINLVKVFDCAMFLSEKKQVLPYWEQAIRLSRKLKFAKTEAACLQWMGAYYKSLHKPDSAFLYFDSSIRIAGNSTDKWLQLAKANSLFQKGMIYESQENLYIALNYYFESLKSYTGIDRLKEKIINGKIADIYRQMNNDEKALQYYRAKLEIAVDGRNDTPSEMEDGAHLSMAEIFLERNELAAARESLAQLARFMPDTVETMTTGTYFHLKGRIALKEGNADSAVAYMKKSLQYYSYTREMHIDDISKVSADIARIELNKKDFPAAKEYADQALVAAKESGHKETMANALVAWAEYSNKVGDRSNAYEALHEATVLNDSVMNATIIKQANTLSAIFENDKKEKTIAQLETDKRIQAASVEHKTLLNIIFIITIGALLIIGVITWLNIKKERKLEQQRMLKLEDEKQMMGIEAMLKGQEEERRRLAKDLHDGLGGMLSGVKMSFSNMRDHIDLSPANALLFEKSLGQLDSTISEMRKVAHNLMPGALIRFGLKSAVRDFCESMQLSAKAKVICEQFGTDRDLGGIADVNIYRIIQELVTNSVKHGHASQVLVQLTIAAENVLISVEDDGRGFDLAVVQARPGIGLSNIRHRVNYFNGKMDIESKPGEGTTVNIELIA